MIRVIVAALYSRQERSLADNTQTIYRFGMCLRYMYMDAKVVQENVQHITSRHLMHVQTYYSLRVVC